MLPDNDNTMTNEEKTQRYQALVEECLIAKRFEEAIALYRRLIDLNPGDDSWRMGLAWACHDSGKTEQAVACFEHLFEKELARQTFTGFAFDELVRIFKESKKYDCLVDVCERAAAVQPDDLAVLGELGDAYLKAGRPGDAVRIFESITEMAPDAPAFLFRLGQAHIGNHDFDCGEAAYRRATSLDGCETRSMFSRMAQSFIQAGRMDKAETALREGLAEHHDDPLLLSDLGDVLIQQGKLSEGWEAYEKIIAFDPSASGVYLNRLGHTLARARRHREAAAAFRRAVASDPQNPFYYLALAEACRALGDLDAAAEALRQAG
jgi:tetratricopeptide (TPR) repeat protein